MKKFFLPALVAASFATLGSLAQAQQHAAQNLVVVAQKADAYTMDPAKHSNFSTANVLMHIYDPLVTRDEKGAFAPALALSWSNPDPLTWRFKLRTGVKFHDGEEFDAQAVKFTFDRALDPATKSPYFSRISAIQQVVVVDKFTVDFKTATPFPTMLYSVYEASFAALIVPPKYIKDHDPAILASKPVGTGPYRFVEWVKDDRVVMEANPDYWGGAPRIKKIIWRPISEPRTRIAELKGGGVDIAENVPPGEIKSLEGNGTRVVNIPSDFLFFFAFDTLKPGPLQDKRVRQAINYAINVEAIQKSILEGTGQRVVITLPKNALGYPADMQPYPYDPAKARQLLKEAGFANGFTIPMMSRQGYYLKDKEIMEAASGFLSKVGIKVVPKYLEPGIWAQVSEKKGREGIIYPGWSGADPDLVWYPLLTTGQYQSYFSNKPLDELLLRGRSTLDPQQRKEAYEAAAKIIKEEAPHLPMFQAPLIFGVNAALQWQARSDTMIDLRHAQYGK
jgi:peptide/nickel transport system substrate-binding protein